MKSDSAFIISLAVSLSIVNIILILTAQSDLKVYYVLDVIVFFINAVFFRLDSRSMLALRAIGTILFVGFVYVLALKIILNFI